MDKASASGAGDSRFESWAGHVSCVANTDKEGPWKEISFSEKKFPSVIDLLYSPMVVRKPWVDWMQGQSEVSPKKIRGQLFSKSEPKKNISENLPSPAWKAFSS